MNRPVSFCRVAGWWALGIVLVATSVGGPKAVGFAAQAPLRVRQEVHDFGSVRRGTVVEGEFRIENLSDKPVSISGVVFHCLCGKILPGVTGVPAKGETVLRFTVDTSGLEGDLKKGIEIHYLADGERRLILTVMGRVDSGWTVEPEALELGALRPGERRDLRIVIRGRDALPADLAMACEASDVRIGVAVPIESTTSVEVRLTITIAADAKAADWTRLVTVRVKDEWKPEFIMTLNGRIEGDLTAVPRVLAFGDVRRQAGARATVVLGSRSGRAFRILDLRAPEPLVAARDSLESASEHRIEVTLPAGIRSKTVVERLIVLCDHPEESEIILSVRARIVDE